MIKAADLKINDKVIYDDGGEQVVAKVTKKDDIKEVVHFIDVDEFRWEEPYKDIPEVVKRIVNDF